MKTADKKTFQSLSIFNGLLLVFSATSLMAVIIMGLVYYFHAEKTLKQLVEEHLSFTLHDAVSHFEQGYSVSVASDLILLESIPTLNNYLAASKQEKILHKFDIEKLFFKLTSSKALYTAATFFDTVGHEVVMVKNHKRIKDLQAISQYPADSIPHQNIVKLFEKLKSSPLGTIMAQGPYLNPEGKWTFLAGIAKREPEIAGFGGVIMLTCDLEDYIKYLSSIVVFNSHPVWLYASADLTLMFRPPSTEPHYDPRSSLDAITDEIEKRTDHSHDFKELAHTHVNALSPFVHSHGIAFGNTKSNLFTMVFSLPPETFSNLTRELLIRVLFVIILMIILCSMVSYFLARQLTRPIIKLVSASHSLAQGNFEIQIPPSGRLTELREFATSFKQMANNLRRLITDRDKEIEQRKKIESSLRQAKDEWEKSFNAIEDIMTIQDKDMRILRVNTTACVFFKARPAELIGKHCYELFRGISEPCEGCPEILTLRDKSSHSHTVVHLQLGKTFQVTTSPILDESGNIEFLIHVAKDVTEQKKLEANVFQARNLEALGVLAGGIAHDFNNLLTGVFGNIDLARLDMDAESEPFQRLTIANSAIKRAKTLTGQLLTFAKGGEPIKETVSIENLIKDTANFIFSGSTIRCDYEITDNLWLVDVDKGQIWQVIHNLLLNAKEAMPKGGIIRIHAKNFSVEKSNHVSLKQGNYIQISIKDEGEGITSENIDRVFEPYFSTKQRGSEKGTGIGLTTCYSIIHKHGGHISIHSATDQGTTATFYLPAHPRKEQTLIPAEKENTKKTTHPRQRRVLVMDDEDLITNACMKMLHNMGHNCVTAADGKQAITLFQEAMTSGNPFDLVILDLTVPGGMGGQEAVKELLAINPEAQVVVSSGYADDPVMAAYEHYGFKAALAKPYRLSELQELLQTLI